MAKTKNNIEIPSLNLINRKEGNIGQQLLQRLREAINVGELKPGERLPSTRSLASSLELARGTVTEVYDQLIAEGYLVTKVGSGTTVALDLFETEIKSPRKTSASESQITLSEKAKFYTALAEQFIAKPTTPFSIAQPKNDVAMDANWDRINRRVRSSKTAGPSTYQEPNGLLYLRNEIANYVRKARSVLCEPEQVIITSGTQQGLYLTAKVLLEEKDKVWIEDPTYLGLSSILKDFKINMVPIPVDENGLDVDFAIKKSPKAKAVYVTPSHQYPLGMVMSMARRQALINWAIKNNSWIIEDDYDSELRYSGHPFPSLQGLDPQRVIYLGTFSKVLYPSLRLGYLILPRPLVKAFAGAKAIIDRHSSLSDQQVLATYMSEGYFESHIRRIRAVYAQKKNLLVELLTKELSSTCSIQNNDQGMHLILWLPPKSNDTLIAKELLKEGIVVRAVSTLYSNGKGRSGLMLGYGGHTNQQLADAVKKLKRTLHRLMISSP
ncbi:MocR-like pyridoxine biosynthesis transcription factor PdxR [Peredibacter starrii]|uniref:PLP-dependent aminotransferase family protein n=1 Tax=Peredibacter starrii TaxID=28202 RepID=A0AAX4HMY8_9BACT|nr:PLP-dependent aminotransferase family protein [Peredibacter starrii]WPU64538.1 PLP-dependent aminotransferase family protein [Peredibacter starrii]